MSFFKDALADISEMTNELFGEPCSLYLIDPYTLVESLLSPVDIIVDKGKPIKGDFKTIIGYRIAAKVLMSDMPELPRGAVLLETEDKNVYELGDMLEQSKTAYWFECLETSLRFPTDLEPKPSFNKVRAYRKFNFTNTTPVIDPVIASYLWDFGDGVTSETYNPQHTYAEAGDYDVTLTVSSNTGYTMSHVETVTAVRNSTPVAAFNFSVFNGNRVDFEDLSTDVDGNITQWQWEYGDGTGATAQDPIHTYTLNGVYDCRLTVTDDMGAHSFVTHTITIQ